MNLPFLVHLVFAFSASLHSGETEGDFRCEGLTVHLAPTARFLYLIVDEKSMMARGESPLVIRDLKAEKNPIVPLHLAVPRVPAEGLVYRSIPRDRDRGLVIEQHVDAHEKTISWNVRVSNRSEKSESIELELAFPLRLKEDWKFFDGKREISDRKEMARIELGTGNDREKARDFVIAAFDGERGLAVSGTAGAGSRRVTGGARRYPGMWKLVFNWDCALKPGESDEISYVMFRFDPEKGGASVPARLKESAE
ncbi:MAG: hypothetical protein QF473_36065 [Planctomycetota bacterium]|jgi:hypothetical protein|nr:hypothetical protein [Planctomycetota bacterium]